MGRPVRGWRRGSGPLDLPPPLRLDWSIDDLRTCRNNWTAAAEAGWSCESSGAETTGAGTAVAPPAAGRATSDAYRASTDEMSDVALAAATALSNMPRWWHSSKRIPAPAAAAALIFPVPLTPPYTDPGVTV